MRTIIIEDELPARAKLEAMLRVIDPSIEVIAQLGSVKETLQWLKNNAEPDLAFVDIQLSDDHSFEIFKQHPVKFPVVFTTAYDKYIMESFEFNSVDYLLKPITEEKLTRSLEKVKKLQKEILFSYAKMLKPGGKMVYATCSIFPSENHEQVKAFLAENPSFKLVHEQKLSPALTGTDGFYMALIRKI